MGWVVAEVVTRIRRRLRDPVLDTTLSLLVPFVAYLVAEEVHGSGVLAVVVAGLILGHRSPEDQSAASRATGRVIWRTVQFGLESVVFLLIGLQLRGLIEDARAGAVANGRIALLCVAVVVAVVVVRVAWVFPSAYLPRLLPSVAAREPRPPWPHVALLGWAGMRGVVTLAAAFGLPADTPMRQALLVAAFAVVASTLLLQGASLPFVVRLLRVGGPDPAQDALQQALVLQRAVDAGRARLEEEARRGTERSGRPPSPFVVKSLSRWGEQIAHSVWERLAMSDPGAETPSSTFRRLRVSMLDAERQVVVDVHRSGAVPPEVLEAVLERLDAEEAMLTAFAEGSVNSGGVLAPEKSHGCRHLRDEPLFAVPSDPSGCADCLALGEHDWVALRMCLRCGHVGCCDSSPRRHATAHFRTTQHPVIRSIELDEAWRWCYLDSELG
jgi:CPA1 family monovalent cation:H+ antiporter